jgi:hypothetical protein
VLSSEVRQSEVRLACSHTPLASAGNASPDDLTHFCTEKVREEEDVELVRCASRNMYRVFWLPEASPHSLEEALQF